MMTYKLLVNNPWFKTNSIWTPLDLDLITVEKLSPLIWI